MEGKEAPYQTVKWRIRRTPDGYEGIVRVPGQICATTLRARVKGPPTGQTKASALAAAAGLAQQALSSPILQAALPPGADLALQTVGKLAGAAKVGKLAEAAADVIGPGAKRLAKALGGLFS